MKGIKINGIKAGKVGHFDIEIPIIKIGNGNPKVTIMTGMHGDEFTGLLIIKKLIDQIELKAGTLQLILCANPLARFSKTRVSPIDLVDINRVFPGDNNGSITNRIAHKLMQIVGDSDLVIDLHTMSNRTKPLPIFVTCGNGIDAKTIDALRAFNQNKIWKVESSNENKYQQTLGALLARQMIPHFGLEMDNIDKISDEDIENVVDGLKNVLTKQKMIEGIVKEIELSFFKRNQFNAHHTGIFLPLKNIDDEINEGDVVGEVLDVNDFEIKEIRSLKKGFVCDILSKMFVHEGEHIFSVGERSE